MNVREAIPGETLLHPVSIAVVATLLVNDHYLKHAAPSALTGKLSDIAGLAFFPLLLQSLWEIGQSLARRQWRPTRRCLVVCIGMTAAIFVAAEVSSHFASVVATVLGALQWPVLALVDLATGHAVRDVPSTRLVADPTDLLALPALTITWWVGARRANVEACGGVEQS